jgi:ABC-type transport system involved in multi-copper enzyme maturation permease subunit
MNLTDIMPLSGWIGSASIVVLCLVVLGVFVFGDVQQFSLQRVWALATVCYRESVRRRVLWVTPIAMIGVIAVSQLAQAVDPPDAIRQTIKYALFATGLLVTMMAVIVSCTSLPKDIETKVIHTIVTKPVTRFELVLGKIVGFARTTFMLLLLMGLFTWGYMHYQQWRWNRTVQAALTTDEAARNPAVKSSLEYYAAHGLLQTRSIDTTRAVHQFASLPPVDAKFFELSTEQTLYAPFSIENAGVPTEPLPKGIGGELLLKFDAAVITPTPVPFRSIDTPDERFFGPPLANVEFANAYDETSISVPAAINEGKPIRLDDRGGEVRVPIDGALVQALAQVKRFFITVNNGNQNYRLRFTPESVRLRLPIYDAASNQLKMADLGTGTDFVSGEPGPQSRGRSGRFAQQLHGQGDFIRTGERTHAVGVYAFTEAREPSTDKVSLELRFGLERSGDGATQDNAITQVGLQVRNRSTGESSPEYYAEVESDRPAFVDNVDPKYIRGGAFDVVVRVRSEGVVVNLGENSVAVVSGRGPFVFNLLAGLLCQWMLGILAVCVGVCASTFVSWPIAIVLSFLVLNLRWMVTQLADSLSGVGSSFVTQIGIQDASGAKTVQVTADAMSWLLRTIAHYLPAIDAFAVGNFVERGLTVPMRDVGLAGLVLAAFGLPLISLAYVILRKKEVAP